MSPQAALLGEGVTLGKGCAPLGLLAPLLPLASRFGTEEFVKTF